MDRRIAVSLEVAGLSVSFEGDASLFEREVRPLMEGVASGGWRARGALVQAPPGPVEEAGTTPPPAEEAPAREVSAPPPRPTEEAFDFRPLLASLGREKGRRAEREAVLAALTGLASEGRRDATPAEVVEWLEARGFPVEGLHPRPILAKLCHRKGMAVPGILRNTYRATPAGAAHVARLIRQG